MTDAERRNAQTLIDLALAEDLGSRGDATSAAFIPVEATGSARFIARKPGVLAGSRVAGLVAEAFEGRLRYEPLLPDGSPLSRGDVIARLHGNTRALLAAERTALNFLQRLSGVATLTRAHVDAVAGTRARVLDTRKTTPGWRLLEKYAVRMGGGHNHRIGLYDAILIKDNHIASLKLPSPDGAVAAVERARASAGPGVPIIVEVDDLLAFRAVLALEPDVILLDNLPPEQMRVAVRERDSSGKRTQLEASGGINLSSIGAVAAVGVDRISVGAITHSAVALDIALDWE
jgi:nicotinate-nucleotide pyrophosphorylase (carboxylating)